MVRDALVAVAHDLAGVGIGVAAIVIAVVDLGHDAVRGRHDRRASGVHGLEPALQEVVAAAVFVVTVRKTALLVVEAGRATDERGGLHRHVVIDADQRREAIALRQREPKPRPRIDRIGVLGGAREQEPQHGDIVPELRDPVRCMAC